MVDGGNPWTHPVNPCCLCIKPLYMMALTDQGLICRSIADLQQAPSKEFTDWTTGHLATCFPDATWQLSGAGRVPVSLMCSGVLDLAEHAVREPSHPTLQTLHQPLILRQDPGHSPALLPACVD